MNVGPDVAVSRAVPGVSLVASPLPVTGTTVGPLPRAHPHTVPGVLCSRSFPDALPR